MPIFVVTARKQIAQTFLVEAENATEAKRLVRDGDDRIDAVGFDEIYPQPKITIMACNEDCQK